MGVFNLIRTKIAHKFKKPRLNPACKGCSFADDFYCELMDTPDCENKRNNVPFEKWQWLMKRIFYYLEVSREVSRVFAMPWSPPFYSIFFTRLSSSPTFRTPKTSIIRGFSFFHPGNYTIFKLHTHRIVFHYCLPPLRKRKIPAAKTVAGCDSILFYFAIL